MDLEGTVYFFPLHFAPKHVESHRQLFGFYFSFRLLLHKTGPIELSRVAVAVVFAMLGLGEVFFGHRGVAGEPNEALRRRATADRDANGAVGAQDHWLLVHLALPLHDHGVLVVILVYFVILDHPNLVSIGVHFAAIGHKVLLVELNYLFL